MSVEQLATPTEAAEPALSSRDRLILWAKLRRQRLREHLEGDSFLFKKASAAAAVAAGYAFRALGKKLRAYRVWSAVHRRDYSQLADRLIEPHFHAANKGRLDEICRAHVAQPPSDARLMRFFTEPLRLLGTRILVLKSYEPGEKGVLLLDYSFSFPLFAKMFDLRKVAERYRIILEPSWRGACDLDILCYTALDFPVFVEAAEPRDFAFFERIKSNLIPVPVGGNWWVDHRVFRPLPDATKDMDVVTVGCWGHYKRHDRLLEALGRLRARGQRLKAILIGYPVDFTMDDVWRMARYFGVADQIELHERLSPVEVNQQMNRAKVNLIWSRREGFNRAVIEGMFAGLPGIVREGWNYGHHYSYINSRTGIFVKESELPERLAWMVQHHHEFSPREWVMENQSPQQATAVLNRHVRARAEAEGERWTRDLAVKVVHLDTMQYWDETDRARIQPDYEFLASQLISGA